MKTHKFDLLSFIAGLLMTATGLLFLLPKEPTDLIDALTSLGTWFWPVVLVGIGLAVLIPAVTPRRAKADEEVAQGDG